VGEQELRQVCARFFICYERVEKECQPPTISTGSIQDSGEKSIGLAKNSTLILRRPPKLFGRDHNRSEIRLPNGLH